MVYLGRSDLKLIIIDLRKMRVKSGFLSPSVFNSINYLGYRQHTILMHKRNVTSHKINYRIGIKSLEYRCDTDVFLLFVCPNVGET